MAFKNCRLEEDKRREYNVEYFEELGAYKTEKTESFRTGTVDDEKNIWLFFAGQLGDPMENEEWDGFIFDYNGEIFYLHLRYEIDKEFTVTWYNLESDRPFDEKQIQSLRDAFRVYKFNGLPSKQNERCEVITRF